MGKPRQSQGNDKAIDPDVDRYPTFVQGMRRILQEAEIPDVPVDRLEVNFLASGECTYRYWTARNEESDGGVLPEE
jgi:hypothetical protein